MDVVTETIEAVRALGPLGSEGTTGEKLEENLRAARDGSCSERLRWLVGKQYSLETDTNVFGEEYPKETFKELLETTVRDEYVKARIVNLTRKEPRSVREMAPELGLDPAEVLRMVTILRGRNIVDVKEVRDTSPLYTALV